MSSKYLKNKVIIGVMICLFTLFSGSDKLIFQNDKFFEIEMYHVLSNNNYVDDYLSYDEFLSVSDYNVIGGLYGTDYYMVDDVLYITSNELITVSNKDTSINTTQVVHVTSTSPNVKFSNFYFVDNVFSKLSDNSVITVDNFGEILFDNINISLENTDSNMNAVYFKNGSSVTLSELSVNKINILGNGDGVKVKSGTLNFNSSSDNAIFNINTYLGVCIGYSHTTQDEVDNSYYVRANLNIYNGTYNFNSIYGSGIGMSFVTDLTKEMNYSYSLNTTVYGGFINSKSVYGAGIGYGVIHDNWLSEDITSSFNVIGGVVNSSSVKYDDFGFGLFYKDNINIYYENIDNNIKFEFLNKLDDYNSSAIIIGELGVDVIQTDINGIFFDSEYLNANLIGNVYYNDELKISSDQKLYIQNNAVLLIDKDFVLLNNGEIENDGIFEIYDYRSVEGDGVLTGNGIFNIVMPVVFIPTFTYTSSIIDSSLINVASLYNFYNQNFNVLTNVEYSSIYFDDEVSDILNAGEYKFVLYDSLDSIISSYNFEVSKASLFTALLPSVSDIISGQSLKSAILNYDNSYGEFAFEDISIIPSVSNNSYKLIFTPNENVLNNYENITLDYFVNVIVLDEESSSNDVDVDNETSGNSSSSNTYDYAYGGDNLLDENDESDLEFETDDLIELNDFTYVIQSDLSNFLKLSVNGTEISPDLYIIDTETNSIKLTDEYVNSLTAGYYEVNILFSDQTYDFTFEIDEIVSDKDTLDEFVLEDEVVVEGFEINSIFIYIAVGISIGVVGILVVKFIDYRKKI